MTDTFSRFSTRVENYAKYRPTYPEALLDVLKKDCALNEDSIIADVGSGTGILSEMFLRMGNRVFGVEPNTPMRQAAERLLKQYSRFVSMDGKAEATTLDQSSVNFITAAQAFHWFDREKARQEFARILKPQGWVVLIWNERRLDSTPFLRDYEDLLLEYGTDYKVVRHENVPGEIERFFSPAQFKLKSLENVQNFDFASLKGRLSSASYTPEPGHRDFEPMISKLQEIFDVNQSNGTVAFEYDTKIFYGQIA
ncbi:MAG: class I SAM-dependent methyltransferase [Pyrinomonadaceae bacterium]